MHDRDFYKRRVIDEAKQAGDNEKLLQPMTAALPYSRCPNRELHVPTPLAINSLQRRSSGVSSAVICLSKLSILPACSTLFFSRSTNSRADMPF